jgi:hypothetical protein
VPTSTGPVVELLWLGVADDGWLEFSAIQCAMWREALTGEPPVPLSELHAEITQAPAHRQTFSLLAVDGGEPVGAADVGRR